MSGSKGKSTRASGQNGGPDTKHTSEAQPLLGLGDGAITGRFLVLLREDASAEGLRMLREQAGIQGIAHSADFDEAPSSPEAIGAECLMFDKLGVAVVRGEPEQFRAAIAAVADESPLLAVEPERVLYACAESSVFADSGSNGDGAHIGYEPLPMILPPAAESPVEPIEAARAPAEITVEYLRGYRDAIDSLIERLQPGGGDAATLRRRGEAFATPSEAQLSWGLQLTRAAQSRWSGRGVRVAVLDTGFDLRHPDFAGRAIRGQSFVQGQAVQDMNGHGTHCIGTACGPRQPGILPRYGIAHGAEIFAGKVLSNQGSGADGWILAGINWAIANQCRVISMSLGASTQPGQPFSQVFEAVARRALARGSLIVAAAGNDSDRAAGVAIPVSHPANCPSILAVAAVDAGLQVASFSNRGLNPMGGQIDIAGPGVNVYSSYPMPQRYRRLNGTSMATPHVAGIAALVFQAYPQATASDVWRILVQSARRLSLSSADVGSGLVQAPV